LQKLSITFLLPTQLHSPKKMEKVDFTVSSADAKRLYWLRPDDLRDLPRDSLYFGQAQGRASWYYREADLVDAAVRKHGKDGYEKKVARRAQRLSKKRSREGGDAVPVAVATKATPVPVRKERKRANTAPKSKRGRPSKLTPEVQELVERLFNNNHNVKPRYLTKAVADRFPELTPALLKAVSSKVSSLKQKASSSSKKKKRPATASTSTGKRRGRPSKLSQEVQDLIQKLFDEDNEVKPRELTKNVADKFPDLTPELLKAVSSKVSSLKQKAASQAPKKKKKKAASKRKDHHEANKNLYGDWSLAITKPEGAVNEKGELHLNADDTGSIRVCTDHDFDTGGNVQSSVGKTKFEKTVKFDTNVTVAGKKYKGVLSLTIEAGGKTLRGKYNSGVPKKVGGVRVTEFNGTKD